MTAQPGPRRAPASPEPAVLVRDVDMDFGAGPLAVRGASFSLAPGRFLTILGPSGSGKTTLLRIIAGFQTPTRGEIRINGHAVTAVAPHRRSIGMVFQKLALFPHMTAAENVAFPLKMRRHDPRSIPGKVERYLDLVRLGGLGTRRIHELSGGQQQRVAIARALVFEPELLLLDEPLAALDRKLREEMQLEFRRIQKELGVTTINVTHDQREALVVSDEIIVMEHGEIQQHARPVEMYRAPANPFVANFIGVSSFLDGRRGPGGLEVAGLSLAGTPAGPVPDGAPARGAIRAEQIRIAADAHALGPCETVLDGTVRDTIFEGERLLYIVDVESLGVSLQVYHHDPEDYALFESGAEVKLGWKARDLLIFNRQDGREGR
ncbi:ABC transporter ATP-binding protein [Cereibacter sphaeroides]|uniref:ABC transporter ATP-binding protein n=1 Tax=Cereibacter sphaeroides TaxID=1063 RepID=UPI001F1B3A0C|nr:ABC transporter ATP-binding protein [Cereibacter sphaeroides]MCE6951599.1 ABC transporter ATP-binding protein [Cereibacter sphaeroides]MCE6959048.1 ABC transporter ATP-binding protein [Cereibacter sphaeroides]MCE6969112.1 ABC transporter ATP-binding protein [Cereibacter sphaeroides]MCE6973610.1 ABC transporter ATP-binding protein [Cereibacter sphaeroides]